MAASQTKEGAIIMLSAIVGVNWGDEGKGRIVDYLSQDFDIVSRYQGGNNAGHTVVNEKGTFILNLRDRQAARKGDRDIPGKLENQRPRNYLHALSQDTGLPRRGQTLR